MGTASAMVRKGAEVAVTRSLGTAQDECTGRETSRRKGEGKPEEGAKQWPKARNATRETERMEEWIDRGGKDGDGMEEMEEMEIGDNGSSGRPPRLRRAVSQAGSVA